MESRLLTAVILGAGFSSIAGLPLAKDLFDSEVFVPSRAAERRFNAVLHSWRAWQALHPGDGPEQFLTSIYRSDKIGPVPWSWATELVAAVLATPLPHDRGTYQSRYAGRITRPVNLQAHNDFWDLILARCAVAAVVTPNYDLLIERGLRHRQTQRPKRPGMHYGGLVGPQILQGTAFPFSVARQERRIELSGGIPLYKLHGSLNWGLEAGALCLYQDNRSAFRYGGDAQIVAPVLEKEVPGWLKNIWDGARQALAGCPTWIVCGYSLPPYDQALVQLFIDAAAAGTVTKIVVMDPKSDSLIDRWQTVAPRSVIKGLPGLPAGLRALVTC